MNIFSFDDYKSFVQKSFQAKPKNGRGEFRRLAAHLRISSVAVSQIFRGSRDLSLEQAFEVGTFLVLDKDEQDFFLLLVETSRAGTKNLRMHYEEKIRAVRRVRQNLSNRVKENVVLSEVAKATFYSNWQYSAIRMASSVPQLTDYESIAERLNLQPSEVAKFGSFLLEQGLCVRDASGFHMGPSSTMLSADSAFINIHRRNWRLKALENLEKLSPTDLYYTGLVSLSEKDLAKFREDFMELVAKFVKNVTASPSETIACLNLDWFELKR